MDKDRRETDIQDAFLGKARKERTVMAVVLNSGKKVTGRVRSYDRYTIVLEDHGSEQMIFKHAIATIGAVRAFSNSVRFEPGESAPDRSDDAAGGRPGGTPGPESGA